MSDDDPEPDHSLVDEFHAWLLRQLCGEPRKGVLGDLLGVERQGEDLVLRLRTSAHPEGETVRLHLGLGGDESD